MPEDPKQSAGAAEVTGSGRGMLYTYVVKLYDNLDRQKLLAEVRELRAEDPYLTPTDDLPRPQRKLRALARSC